MTIVSIVRNIFQLDYTVEIKNGTIRGKPITTIHDKIIYAFIEIPYASPPVGRLRFQVSSIINVSFN